MGTFLAIIISVAIAIALVYALYIGLSRLLCKFPALVWILSIGGGVIIGVLVHWIAGIIACIFLLGFLSMAQSSTGRKCSHCGSYNTKLLRNDPAVWKCKECGGVTAEL